MTYVNKEYWDGFYKKQTNLFEPSSFSDVLLNDPKINSNTHFIIDIGCGTGKDTFYFATKQFEVIGLDGSKEVVKRNEELKKEKYSYSDISFICQDLSDDFEVKKLMNYFNVVAQEKNKKIVFYNRFFLHAIPEPVEDILFEAILEKVDVEYTFFSEFRTIEDKDLDKTFNNHYRRYIDTDDFRSKIKQLGFELDFFKKGQNMSIYKDENPYLCRMKFNKKGE